MQKPLASMFLIDKLEINQDSIMTTNSTELQVKKYIMKDRIQQVR